MHGRMCNTFTCIGLVCQDITIFSFCSHDKTCVTRLYVLRTVLHHTLSLRHDHHAAVSLLSNILLATLWNSDRLPQLDINDPKVAEK